MLVAKLNPASTIAPVSNDKQKKNLSTVGSFIFNDLTIEKAEIKLRAQIYQAFDRKSYLITLNRNLIHLHAKCSEISCFTEIRFI